MKIPSPARNPRAQWASLLLALVVSMCAILGVSPAPAAADESFGSLDCDSIVVDSSSELGDATPVVIASNDAQQFGRVRIRVRQESGGEHPGQLATAASDCGWLGDDGLYQNDMLVISVSIDERSTLVRYGSDWAPSLDDSVDVIMNRVINPQFGEGNYAAGLSGGLKQFAARRGEVDGSAQTPTTATPTSMSTTLLAPSTTVTETTDSTIAAGSLVPQPAPVEPSEPVVAASDGQSGAQLVGDVRQDNSALGVYAMIAGALAAAFLLPIIVLRRQDRASQERGSEEPATHHSE